MSKETNRIASEFLRHYLRRNPTAECCKVVPTTKLKIDYSEETATNFLMNLKAQEAADVVEERIEISEPKTVVVLRVCPRNLPAFLAGVHRGKLIWTYHQHLARVFQRDEATAVSKMLEEQSTPNYFLPAPEHKHSSF